MNTARAKQHAIRIGIFATATEWSGYPRLIYKIQKLCSINPKVVLIFFLGRLIIPDSQVGAPHLGA